MNPILRVFVIAASALPLAGVADSLSYNYWQAGYVAADIDNLDETVDGWGVGGALKIAGRVYLTAAYTDVSTDIDGFKISEQDTAIGIGYAWPLSDSIDLNGRVGWVGAKAEIEGIAEFDDDAYSLVLGLRGRVSDQLDLEGFVQYADFSKLDDSTSLGLGVQWYFTPDVAVALFGTYSDDAVAYGIGLRGTWGRD